MLTFKSLSDLDQLPGDDPAHLLVQELLALLASVGQSRPYCSDVHGYVVLIQPADIDRVLPLPEIQRYLAEVPWEGVTQRAGFFHAAYVPNNEFCLSCLIPDAPWVNGRLRASLEAHLSR